MELALPEKHTTDPTTKDSIAVVTDSAIKILIAEDAANIRFGLTRLLQKWGYEVFAAEDGEVAWKILNEENISIVISDWMMPECDGIELCKRLRGANLDHYVYFILLTSRDDKGAVVEGLRAGADDYLVKPFERGELEMRVKAGERIIDLERKLDARNRDLVAANDKINHAYALLEEDLNAASEMQKNLLPVKPSESKDVSFHWLFDPSTFVGGDILGYLDMSDGQVVFYNVDVSGHGVQAAMLTVGIAKFLEQHGFINTHGRQGNSGDIDPARVLEALNHRFQTNVDDGRYFTIVLGVYSPKDSLVTFSQAGHPHPICIRADGGIEKLGGGGFPVGMLPNIEYENTSVAFASGDRLFLHSDGITECENPAGEQFGDDRVCEILRTLRNRPMAEAVKTLQEEIIQWQESSDFEDDVSLLCIERVDDGAIESVPGEVT